MWHFVSMRSIYFFFTFTCFFFLFFWTLYTFKPSSHIDESRELTIGVSERLFVGSVFQRGT